MYKKTSSTDLFITEIKKMFSINRIFFKYYFFLKFINATNQPVPLKQSYSSIYLGFCLLFIYENYCKTYK